MRWEEGRLSVSFKPKKDQPHKLELVSLIDMIFILLVFFLVTSFVIRMPLQERNLYVPTPKNEQGRAQIVIQILSSDSSLWIDESASELVSRIEEDYGYLSEERLKQRILDRLIHDNRISNTEMNERLDRLCKRADQNPQANYFILIRCPNEIPYSMVVDLIARIHNTAYRNVRYGCVGGTLDDLRNCRRIRTVAERVQGERRKSLVIDFN